MLESRGIYICFFPLLSLPMAGSIPLELGKPTALQDLNLWNNKLTGESSTGKSGEKKRLARLSFQEDAN